MTTDKWTNRYANAVVECALSLYKTYGDAKKAADILSTCIEENVDAIHIENIYKWNSEDIGNERASVVYVQAVFQPLPETTVTNK